MYTYKYLHGPELRILVLELREGGAVGCRRLLVVKEVPELLVARLRSEKPVVRLHIERGDDDSERRELRVEQRLEGLFIRAPLLFIRLFI